MHIQIHKYRSPSYHFNSYILHYFTLYFAKPVVKSGHLRCAQFFPVVNGADINSIIEMTFLF